MFAGNFAPPGWATCDGQLLSIAQNQALFALLGTAFGGNGVVTYALPDLRGRVPIHKGQGPSLTFRTMGDKGGSEEGLLLIAQIPKHSHDLMGSESSATGRSPQPGQVFAEDSRIYGSPGSGLMSPSAISYTGGANPHSNLQPFLSVTFIIALQGIFPSQN